MKKKLWIAGVMMFLAATASLWIAKRVCPQKNINFISCSIFPKEITMPFFLKKHKKYAVVRTDRRRMP